MISQREVNAVFAYLRREADRSGYGFWIRDQQLLTWAHGALQAAANARAIMAEQKDKS